MKSRCSIDNTLMEPSFRFIRELISLRNITLTTRPKDLNHETLTEGDPSEHFSHHNLSVLSKVLSYQPILLILKGSFLTLSPLPTPIQSVLHKFGQKETGL